MQRPDRHKYLNPLISDDEGLVIFNLQKRPAEERKILFITHEWLDYRVFNCQRLAVRASPRQHFHSTIYSPVNPILFGISPGQVFVSRQKRLNKNIFWTQFRGHSLDSRSFSNSQSTNNSQG